MTENQVDPLSTFPWYKEVITDPYEVLTEFFKSDTLSSYRKTIKKTLLACNSKKIYRKRHPGELLFEFKMLESVLKAAYHINEGKKKILYTADPNNIFDKELYCGKNKYITEWNYVPRSLSMKEYIDPYLGFRRFFKFQTLDKWKHDMDEILEHALTRESFYASDIKSDTLSIYFYLTKLVEAAHLIDIRRIKEDKDN